MLECRLLGEIRFLMDARPLASFPTPKAAYLLCYLLLHRERRHPRARLIDTFWPDRDEHSARRCLSTTLWRLRRTLGDEVNPSPFLAIEGDSIGFHTGCPIWLDVTAFEQAAQETAQIRGQDLSPQQAEMLQAAVALYRGDLMEGAYDDWCLIERERLASLHLQMLSKLMGFCRRHRRFTEATDYGQRILTIDPLHETTHRDMMRLYCEKGDRAAAIRQFERCRALLAQEMGIEPMQETLDLYAEIRAQTEPCVPSPAVIALEADAPLRQALVRLAESQTQVERAAAELARATAELARAREAVEQLTSQQLLDRDPPARMEPVS